VRERLNLGDPGKDFAKSRRQFVVEVAVLAREKEDAPTAVALFDGARRTKGSDSPLI
jgi:hypothetical protein